MKKFLGILIVLLIAISLIACDKDSGEEVDVENIFAQIFDNVSATFPATATEDFLLPTTTDVTTHPVTKLWFSNMPTVIGILTTDDAATATVTRSHEDIAVRLAMQVRLDVFGTEHVKSTSFDITVLALASEIDAPLAFSLDLSDNDATLPANSYVSVETPINVRDTLTGEMVPLTRIFGNITYPAPAGATFTSNDNNGAQLHGIQGGLRGAQNFQSPMITTQFLVENFQGISLVLRAWNTDWNFNSNFLAGLLVQTSLDGMNWTTRANMRDQMLETDVANPTFVLDAEFAPIPGLSYVRIVMQSASTPDNPIDSTFQLRLAVGSIDLFGIATDVYAPYRHAAAAVAESFTGTFEDFAAAVSENTRVLGLDLLNGRPLVQREEIYNLAKTILTANFADSLDDIIDQDAEMDVIVEFIDFLKFSTTYVLSFEGLNNFFTGSLFESEGVLHPLATQETIDVAQDRLDAFIATTATGSLQTALVATYATARANLQDLIDDAQDLFDSIVPVAYVKLYDIDLTNLEGSNSYVDEPTTTQAKNTITDQTVDMIRIFSNISGRFHETSRPNLPIGITTTIRFDREYYAPFIQTGFTVSEVSRVDLSFYIWAGDGGESRRNFLEAISIQISADGENWTTVNDFTTLFLNSAVEDQIVTITVLLPSSQDVYVRIQQTRRAGAGPTTSGNQFRIVWTNFTIFGIDDGTDPFEEFRTNAANFLTMFMGSDINSINAILTLGEALDISHEEFFSISSLNQAALVGILREILEAEFEAEIVKIKAQTSELTDITSKVNLINLAIAAYSAFDLAMDEVLGLFGEDNNTLIEDITQEDIDAAKVLVDKLDEFVSTKELEIIFLDDFALAIDLVNSLLDHAQHLYDILTDKFGPYRIAALAIATSFSGSNEDIIAAILEHGEVLGLGDFATLGDEMQQLLINHIAFVLGEHFAAEFDEIIAEEASDETILVFGEFLAFTNDVLLTAQELELFFWGTLFEEAGILNSTVTQLTIDKAQQLLDDFIAITGDGLLQETFISLFEAAHIFLQDLIDEAQDIYDNKEPDLFESPLNLNLTTASIVGLANQPLNNNNQPNIGTYTTWAADTNVTNTLTGTPVNVIRFATNFGGRQGNTGLTTSIAGPSASGGPRTTPYLQTGFLVSEVSRVDLSFAVWGHDTTSNTGDLARINNLHSIIIQTSANGTDWVDAVNFTEQFKAAAIDDTIVTISVAIPTVQNVFIRIQQSGSLTGSNQFRVIWTNWAIFGNVEETVSFEQLLRNAVESTLDLNMTTGQRPTIHGTTGGTNGAWVFAEGGEEILAAFEKRVNAPVHESDFYVKVPGISDATFTEITINGIVYQLDATRPMGFGQSVIYDMPLWGIRDGNLYVHFFVAMLIDDDGVLNINGNNIVVLPTEAFKGFTAVRNGASAGIHHLDYSVEDQIILYVRVNGDQHIRIDYGVENPPLIISEQLREVLYNNDIRSMDPRILLGTDTLVDNMMHMNGHSVGNHADGVISVTETQVTIFAFGYGFIRFTVINVELGGVTQEEVNAWTLDSWADKLAELIG